MCLAIPISWLVQVDGTCCCGAHHFLALCSCSASSCLDLQALLMSKHLAVRGCLTPRISQALLSGYVFRCLIILYPHTGYLDSPLKLSRNLFVSENTRLESCRVNLVESVAVGGRAAAVVQAGVRLAGEWSRFRLAGLWDSLVGFKTSLAVL